MAPSREIEKLQRRWQENPLGLTFAPLAEAYRKEGLYADALELLSIGLAQHPNYVPAHIVRGRCFLDTYADGSAESAFQKVTELDPENVIALKGLADIAERGGRFGDATSRLERLLEIDRSNEDARAQFDRLVAMAPPPNVTAPTPVPASVAVPPNDVAAPPVEPPPFLPPAIDVAGVPDAAAASIPFGEPTASVPAPAPDDDPIPRAAIVDFDPTEVEVVLYQPLELTSTGSGEFQMLDDAAALGARVAEPVHEPEPVAAEAALSVENALTQAETSAVDGSLSPLDAAAEPDAAPSVEDVRVEARPVEPTPLDETPDEPVAASSLPDSGQPIVTHREDAVTGYPVDDDVDAEEDAGEAAEVDAIAEPSESLPRDDDAEAVEGVEADPELVVTETMAEIFLRQGHRELALAVYTQLSNREPGNARIISAIELLHQELKPDGPPALPAFAAVLTGGQSVRGYFERLLSASRPGKGAAPRPTGPSLGAVFGDDAAAGSHPAAPTESGPSYDEFYGDDLKAGDVPAASAAAGSDEGNPDDLEGFTSWLKGLKR